MRDVPADQEHGAGLYEIRVRGHLDSRWTDWFDGMTLTRLDGGSTVIHGPVTDQSALHGLLRTLHDIGLPLLSVAQVPTGADATTRPAHPSAPAPSRRSTPWPPPT